MCKVDNISPTQNVSLNSVKDWLSYDVVRFKIELGVEVKFMCKNVQKRNKTNATWRYTHAANSYGQAVILLRRSIQRHTDAYAESSRI